MKIMIATMTYPADAVNGRNDAVRETWRNDWVHTDAGETSTWDAGSDWTDVDQRFFTDATCTDPAEDEIVLDAPTGLMNTSFKTWRLCQWLMGTDYDYAFVVPTDCYVCVPRLVVSGFQMRDYTGFKAYDEDHIGGGSGYWLSRRAMRIIAERLHCDSDYEDRWAGGVLKAGGISLFHDARYWSKEQTWLPGIITAHLSDEHSASYDPDWMRWIHENYLEFGEIGDPCKF